MNFSSYADFRNRVQTLLDGDDISQSDLSTAVLDTLIGTAEERIYRVLRTSTQETALSITATSNSAPLPADFLELKGNPYVAGNYPAIYAPWEAIQQQIQTGSRTDNHPIYFSYEGDNMIFYPTQNAVTITGRYFKSFSDIATGGLNALFVRHPDIFLYGALAEATAMLGDSRAQMFEAKFASLVRDANELEKRRMKGDGKLTTRIA